jgi:hypothetical protein
MPLGGAAMGMIGQMAGNVGSGLSGIVSGIVGIGQKKKANKILAENPYPTYQIPKEVFANQEMAQNNANTGLPSEQYSMAMKNIQRNQNAALSAATDRRGGNAAIGAIQGQANNATAGLDAQNAAARMQNQRVLMGVNNNVASFRDRSWDWNTRNKYDQNHSYGMSLLGMGNANIMHGIDKTLSGLIGGAASGGGSKGGQSQSMGGLGGNASIGNIGGGYGGPGGAYTAQPGEYPM